jgi:hypothetical protein
MKKFFTGFAHENRTIPAAPSAPAAGGEKGHDTLYKFRVYRQKCFCTLNLLWFELIQGYERRKGEGIKSKSPLDDSRGL